MGGSETELDRRGVLKRAAGAALAAPLAFDGAAWAAGHGYRNAPKGGTVTFGFNLAQTGPNAEEGAEQRRACLLAVEHLNGGGDGGMLKIMRVGGGPPALTGQGVLGRKVVLAIGDAGASAPTARQSALRLIDRDRAVMIAGGSASRAAQAVQALCHEAGIVFMAGVAHGNALTGWDRRPTGFRHFLNSEMSAAALAPVLASEFGPNRRAYHITTDYPWGWSQEEAIAIATEAIGWDTAARVRAPFGAADFAPYLRSVLDAGADALVLNLYGLDLAAALRATMRLGLRDKAVNGRDVAVVAPLHTESVARHAGSSLAGVIGTANWHRSSRDAGSRAFTESFTTEYGFPPGQAAQTCYVQTLLYANACETAGTFHPEGVVAALEDLAFDGMGNGPALYRAEDHQCFKDVLALRGRETAASDFERFEIAATVRAAQVTYAPDDPRFI